MSSMSEDTDPSENRAAARSAAAGPLPSRGTFNRFELNRILNLYGRMVADGEWRGHVNGFFWGRGRVLGVPPGFGRANLKVGKKTPALRAQGDFNAGSRRVLGVPPGFGSANLQDRKRSAACAQAGHLQRDLCHRPDPAPGPRARPCAAGDRPQARGGLVPTCRYNLLGPSPGNVLAP